MPDNASAQATVLHVSAVASKLKDRLKCPGGGKTSAGTSSSSLSGKDLAPGQTSQQDQLSAKTVLLLLCQGLCYGLQKSHASSVHTFGWWHLATHVRPTHSAASGSAVLPHKSQRRSVSTASMSEESAPEKLIMKRVAAGSHSQETSSSLAP